MHVSPAESVATTLGVWLELWALLWAGWENREGLPFSETPEGAREAVRRASSGTPPGKGSGALSGLTRGEDPSGQQQPQQGVATTWALPRSSRP